jgi:alpha-beta hydrolase superfamily lysophospholipase
MITTEDHTNRVGPTIVLVHGAFADASRWNGVIERLQQDGYVVVAPANPLRGVTAGGSKDSILGTAGSAR